MSKKMKVTGVKKAMGDYKKGTNGVVYYNLNHRVVYYEELPEGATGINCGPSVVAIGFKMGTRTSGETMDSIKAKVTSHYLSKEELGMSNYNYAEKLSLRNKEDPRVIAYTKFYRILITNIF